MSKFRVLVIVLVIVAAALAFFYLTGERKIPSYTTVAAAQQELRLTVSTNGIIEPLERSEVYAPIDGRVTAINFRAGEEISRGQTLIELESERIRTALAEAGAALLDARRQEKAIRDAPPKEEITAIDLVINEASLQLAQTNRDLQTEEELFRQGAVARTAVETLQRQREQLELRIEDQKRRRQEKLDRYSAEEKQWEQDKVRQLSDQVDFLRQQRRLEVVTAPKSGQIYALEVKPGATVSQGQLLAQINQPGRVRLRAYVDEPDLGRITRGQPVVISWDGLPDRQWQGVVERPAEQVVSLNNRTIGYVLCSIEGEAKELIPNLNVKVEITTASKPAAVVVPRSAVFSPDGKQSVMIFDGKKVETRAVTAGLVTPEEIEILAGVSVGEPVVINPLDARQ